MKPVTVLMYHAIVDGAETGADPHYSVSPAVFRHQLQLILQHGGRVSGIRQARWPAPGAGAHPVCLTFDDGQRSNLAAAEEIARVGGSAEFFVNPSMVGQPGFLDWPALREMAAMGMSIQSHGMHHRYLDQLSPADVRAELADSKAAIEDAIGQAVVIYAPAGGRMPDDFLSMAHSIGYETVCSASGGLPAVLCRHPHRYHSRALYPNLRYRPRRAMVAQPDRPRKCRGWPCCTTRPRHAFWPGSPSIRQKC